MMGYGYYGHMNGWGVAAVSIGSLLLWVALVLGAVALLRHLRTTPTRVDGPQELLASRYARGEIDDAEYSHRRDTLLHSSVPTTAVR